MNTCESIEALAVRLLYVANNSLTDSIWKNGHMKWAYSESLCVWFEGTNPLAITAACLGDRMIAFNYGVDRAPTIIGSTSKNWHCKYFGLDLCGALDWVADCEHSEAGFLLWSGL